MALARKHRVKTWRKLDPRRVARVWRPAATRASLYARLGNSTCGLSSNRLQRHIFFVANSTVTKVWAQMQARLTHIRWTRISLKISSLIYLERTVSVTTWSDFHRTSFCYNTFKASVTCWWAREKNRHFPWAIIAWWKPRQTFWGIREQISENLRRSWGFLPAWEVSQTLLSFHQAVKACGTY